ncbi:hypothetical protein HLB23_14195 [Nocardia uniformis]|uniref:Uncharacterized protein n=1 Tax=Nocardia uniformis TaxID=53432 RepID=A0A849C3I0_9NOCA|nr:hypothetical protein [Nocardia uniformis]NNH71000.1 hypothetical protein [Nocardia uniformis]
MNRSRKVLITAVTAAVLPLVTAVSASATDDNTFDSKAECEQAIPYLRPELPYNDDETFQSLKYCRMGLDRKWHITNS